MDYIGTIVDIAAVLMVIVGAYLEFRLNRVINYQSGESEYYRDLYEEYLMKTIPDAMNTIEQKICDIYEDNPQQRIYVSYDSITDTVNKLVKDSFFAKHEDRDFYSKISKCVSRIEDECNALSTMQCDFSESINNYYKIDVYIAELYKIILDKNLKNHV